MRAPLTFFSLLSSTFFATGCAGFKAASDAAERAVGEIHAQYNEGKFVDIQKAVHAKFPLGRSEENLPELMQKMKTKLGKVTGTSNAGVNIKTVNSTTTVTRQQKTKFERGTANETFTFQMEGDKALLTGYQIESAQLDDKW